MTPDTPDIVERLRQLSQQQARHPVLHNGRVLTERDSMYWLAADEIASLRQRVAELDQVARYETMVAQAAIERAEAAESQRDAALEALRQIARLSMDEAAVKRANEALAALSGDRHD